MSQEKSGTKWFKEEGDGSRNEFKKDKRRKTNKNVSARGSSGRFNRKNGRRSSGIRFLKRVFVRGKRTKQSIISATWTFLKLAIAISIVVAISSYSIGLLDGSGMGSLGGLNATERSPISDDSTDIPDDKGASYVSADDLDRHRIELLILKRVNTEREERGLSPVDYDLELQEIARYHSEDMAENGYFAHTSPGGETVMDRYQKFGYKCRVKTDGNSYMTGSENIAYTYHRENIEGVGYLSTEKELANGLMNQWMNSTGHRKNILTPEWENLGVGIFITEEDGQTVVYSTQNFC